MSPPRRNVRSLALFHMPLGDSLHTRYGAKMPLLYSEESRGHLTSCVMKKTLKQVIKKNSESQSVQEYPVPHACQIKFLCWSFVILRPGLPLARAHSHAGVQ